MACIGVIFGASLGSLLFSIGGFSTPFFFTGSFFGIVLFLIYPCLSTDVESSEISARE